MIQKKVCMVGAFAVGKTSLVQRFVQGLFSDRYLTTVGVKVDRKTVLVGDTDVKLILWDLAGEDQFQRVRTTYLRGSAGCLLVVDGTRGSTLEEACRIHDRVVAELGALPFVAALNKSDLVEEWEVDGQRLDDLARRASATVRTSAKTGQGVELAFDHLARLVIGGG